MPKKSSVFGVGKINIGIKDPALTIPALNAATLVGSSTPPDSGQYRPGTTRPKLTAGDYKFWVAPLGYDNVNGGYSIGRSTATPGSAVTVDSGDFLELYMASPLPSGLQNAIAMAVFLQKATEDPKMVDWAFINPASAFSWLVTTLGGDNAPTVPVATLTSTTANAITGNRTPVGVDWGPTLDTTGGIEFSNPVETLTESPDNSQDFQVKVGQLTNLAFKIRGQGMKDISFALGYDYVQFTNTDGKVVQQSTGDIFDIVSQLNGNGAVRVTQPRAGVGGRIEKALFLGMVHASTAELRRRQGKLEPTGMDIALNSANLDYLLDGMGNTVMYSDG